MLPVSGRKSNYQMVDNFKPILLRIFVYIHIYHLLFIIHNIDILHFPCLILEQNKSSETFQLLDFKDMSSDSMQLFLLVHEYM